MVASHPGLGAVVDSAVRARVVVADSADHVPRGAAGSAVHGLVLVVHQLDPEDGTGAPTSARLHLPSGLRGKKTSQQEHKPRGPIKEKSGGRIYAVDDLEDDANVEIDDVATKADEALDDLKVDESVDRVDDQDEE